MTERGAQPGRLGGWGTVAGILAAAALGVGLVRLAPRLGIGVAPVSPLGTPTATWGDPSAPGETLLRLEGPPLASTVEVPLWLAVAEADPDDKCALHHEAAWFVRGDGVLYVDQYNSWCATTGPGCMVRDPATGTWSVPPSGCIDRDGIHTRLRALGDDWVEVASDSEGMAEVRWVRWSPSRGEVTEARASLGGSGTAAATLTDPGQLVVRSPCDLGAGGCAGMADVTGDPERTWVLTDGRFVEAR